MNLGLEDQGDLMRNQPSHLDCCKHRPSQGPCGKNITLIVIQQNVQEMFTASPAVICSRINLKPWRKTTAEPIFYFGL